MSIRINKDKCVGCGRCKEVCPGNLIKLEDQKATIKRVKDCWGCTSCLKECKFCAIEFFLGADIGGHGGTLSYQQNGDEVIWSLVKDNTVKETITLNRKDANKY